MHTHAEKYSLQSSPITSLCNLSYFKYLNYVSLGPWIFILSFVVLKHNSYEGSEKVEVNFLIYKRSLCFSNLVLTRYFHKSFQHI